MTKLHDTNVIFSFQQSLASDVLHRTIKTLGPLTIVLITCYIWLRVPFSEHQYMPWIIFPLIFVVPFAKCFYEIFKRSKGSGAWHIQVTPDALLWQSPIGIGEESFSVNVSEMLTLAKIDHKGNEDRESHSNYYIIKRNGEEIKLPIVAKLNNSDVLNALEKAGVKWLR